MARPMTPEETRRFLAAGTRTGKVAIVRRDGSPMVVPIWFDVDDDSSLVFTTHEDTVKARVLRREPRVSICVDDQIPPYSFVRVDGVTETTENAPDLLRWATRLGARYMGTARADEYGRRNAVPGELLIRVRPLRTVALAAVAD